MEKKWLKHYDSGVPHTLQPYLERTLADVVSDAAQQRPDHPALFFQGARLSCREVEQLSNALATALVALGVQKGDRVALILPNCPQWVIGQLGAWKAGAIVVPMSFLYAEPEMRRTLIDCGARVALVLTPFYSKLKAAQPGTPLRHIIATNIKEYLPAHMRFLFSMLREKSDQGLGRAAGGSGSHGGGSASLLQAEPGLVQGAQADRFPRQPAEIRRRQSPAAGAGASGDFAPDYVGREAA